MKLISRTTYLTKLLNVIGTPDIKVITGIRRCGKSKLLETFMNYIETNISDLNIIYINFNLSKYDDLKNSKSLIEHVEANYKDNCQNFLIIDEIQMCQGFEKAINGFHAEENMTFI